MSAVLEGLRGRFSRSKKLVVAVVTVVAGERSAVTADLCRHLQHHRDIHVPIPESESMFDSTMSCRPGRTPAGPLSTDGYRRQTRASSSSGGWGMPALKPTVLLTDLGRLEFPTIIFEVIITVRRMT